MPGSAGASVLDIVAGEAQSAAWASAAALEARLSCTCGSLKFWEAISRSIYLSNCTALHATASRGRKGQQRKRKRVAWLRWP